MEKDVIGDTSGGFSELLLELLKGERDQGSSVNHKQAQEDAKKLCNVSIYNLLVFLIVKGGGGS